MYSELATCMDSEGGLGVQTPNPSGKSQSYIGFLMDTGVPHLLMRMSQTLLYYINCMLDKGKCIYRLVVR